jgi:outer membrane protein assembly factor BamB
MNPSTWNRLAYRLLGGCVPALLVCLATSPTLAAINAGNVAALTPKWTFAAGAGVTAQPVLANGVLYVTSWDGFLYALDPDTGMPVWSFDTGSGSTLGVQSTPLVTTLGTVCIGDSNSRVWCRDALTGAAVWDKLIGNPAVDHIWSGLAAANGRLFVSIASHSDVPCTKGRLVALDLATGADLWSFQTVPNNICSTDTAISCTADVDCPASGTCVDAKGAGITATVSSDPTGAFVYMNTVGCYTFPSIGDSDSMLKLDAATGGVVWRTRVDPPEQFGACSHDASIDCGTNAECGGTNTCQTKIFYHDFGFLNGPTPVDLGAQTLLISGSKNGTLYALDEATGGIVWSNAVRPKPVTPAFAAFGLFNGPLAIADGRVHAALYDFSPSLVPAPPHLQAFDVATGATLWTAIMPASWSGIGAANGIIFTGSNTLARSRVHNAATGALVANLILPAISSAVATVASDTLFVGYGIFGGDGGVVAFSFPQPSAKAALKCRRTAAKESVNLVQQRAKSICKCEVAKITGTLPASTVCIRDDAKTVSQLDKAAVKMAAKIEKTCGGVDKACDGQLSGEVGAANIGFGAACGGLEGLGRCVGGTAAGDVCTVDGDCSGGGTCVGCGAAIASEACGGAITCLDCVASVATKQLDDLLSRNLVATDPLTQSEANKCQQEIQRSVWKFAIAKSKILHKCWDKRLLGKHGDVCPDAAAAEGSEAKKAAEKIAKEETKKVAKVCAACGGSDHACGGSPDVALAAIYNPVPVCPAVTLPGPPFTACGGITVATMQDLVDCLDCVAEFKVDCTTANQVPALVPYPTECQ